MLDACHLNFLKLLLGFQSDKQKTDFSGETAWNAPQKHWIFSRLEGFLLSFVCDTLEKIDLDYWHNNCMDQLL